MDWLTLYVVDLTPEVSGTLLCRIGETDGSALLCGEWLDLPFDEPVKRFDTSLTTYESDKIEWLASCGYEIRAEDSL